ncbi:AAA family ATPase [Agrobacterium tumefaciens]|nr:MobF family relaxase [Agrobacterium tumefaciens]TQN61477.1 AAA family ATPase [Agrobacterium tumefaciens]
MVATWNPAASAGYYTNQTGYYTRDGGVEPRGVWYAPGGDLGLTDGRLVDAELFERLFAGKDADGRSLITNGGGRLDRVPAFDVTLSAPRSVSLVWALGDEQTRQAIEAAHARAVRQTLEMLEREAAFARRGRGGERIERVALTAATFRHGESRPAEHADGVTFADPNLHTHCVVLNLATRGDGSVGALHSTVLRDWKMTAGAVYHAALAAGVMDAGFVLDRIGKNGTFEIAGIGDDAIGYFSARRQEIVEELALAGVESGNAAALAAAVAKTTRAAKTAGSLSREEAWSAAASRIGFDVETSLSLAAEQDLDGLPPETPLSDRLATLPASLTETRSVLDRRDLFRAVGEVLVGTGFGAERVEAEVDRLLAGGLFVEIGRDRLGLPRYSTPEMIRIEREIVEMAAGFAAKEDFAVDQERLGAECSQKGLSEEQTAAVLDVTRSQRIAVVEGAPGTGKTTLLSPAVQAWKDAGYRVVGAATAWRVANALRYDLAIEARATASWLALVQHGKLFLDARTVLIVDEAGLLSSREMHDLLSHAKNAEAKVLLAGDRDQLQAIGAGSGLRLVAHAVDTAKVATIVRQHEAWAREAVTAFGTGDAKVALNAFAERGLLTEVNGQTAAIRAVVDRIEDTLLGAHPETALILARTNAEVAAIGQEVRGRLRNHGIVTGEDMAVTAVTPSGHATSLAFASGDRIRFLTRNDDLGVVNGTVGTIMNLFMTGESTSGLPSGTVIIEARISQRTVRFSTADIADEHGRAKLGWAYASTLYGAQGVTVDKAAVLLSPAFDRHDIYVAASRARQETALVIDRNRIDAEMRAGTNAPDEPDPATRRDWLAERLATRHVKETTLDVASAVHSATSTAEQETPSPAVPPTRRTRGISREVDHAL